MVHSLKPAPDTNIQTPDRYWDFMTLSPESTHMMTWVFSDYGTPASYREMEGFGVHSFKWINEEGKIVYIKYHWKPQQGVRNLNAKEVQEVQGKTSIMQLVTCSMQSKRKSPKMGFTRTSYAIR